MKKILIIILMGYLTLSLNAQDFNKAKLDSLFEKIESYEKGMGSISIFNNEIEIYQNSFGFADIENEIRSTKKTKYRIGSVSKTFTATIIMQLIDENKLSLYTKLAEFYPEIPNANEITIEQLLRHRSGLYNFTNSADYQNWMEKPHLKSEVIKIFIENGVVFEPDEKAEYSNTNYVLLSYIAEKIEQKEFSEILNKRIIEPCNLKSTYYGGKINTAENEAFSYTKLAAWELTTETDMSVPVGAGGIVSNSTDLNIFYNHLFNGKLVSDNLLNEMKKIIDGYGIGMFQLFDKKGFGHTGGIDGFQSKVTYFPEDNVFIAYTSNGVAMPINDILLGALDIFYGNEYILPEFKLNIKLKSEDLDKYLGVYSSSTNPLKITISKDNTVLIAQATGQPAFPLEAYELHKFKFEPAKIEFEFIPEKNKMILKQGGGEFELIREKHPNTIESEIEALIFPDPSKKIVILQAVKSETEFFAGKLLTDGAVKEGILKELNEPFHQSLIKLSQCSRNLSGNTKGPNVLFLSKNQGGFARHGLTLIENDKSINYPNLNYVDLVVNEEKFESGGLNIYSHELGHAMMHNVWENFFTKNARSSMSPKMHVSMGITDYYMAIFEGYGEHFQRLTNENISLYQDLFEQKYRKADNTSILWHSSIDEELRLTGVLNNKYIYQKLLPQGVDITELSSEERILLYHTSPMFDPTRLRNAQQMLSCEGVVATLFYKMNTNNILQNNYLKKDFYNKFLLLPIPDDTEIISVFTPFENVMLKHFWIWYKLNDEDMVGKAPLIEYINEWITEFPEDKEELISIFINITVGKTVNNELADIYEKLSFQGLIGDYYKYVETRTTYQEELRNLIKQVMDGDTEIDGNIGHELWIENKEFQIRQMLWLAEPKNNLRFNVNTANEFELASFKNIDLEQAKKIIAKRNIMGYFISLDQLKEFGITGN